MTVGLNSGIDYTQWLQSSRANYTNGTSENISGATASNSLERTGESDYFVSESGETCTDGKDDGKIGFLSVKVFFMVFAPFLQYKSPTFTCRAYFTYNRLFTPLE